MISLNLWPCRLAKLVVDSHIASHPNTRAAAEAAELESMQGGEAAEQDEPINTIFGVRVRASIGY
eukprot:SAG11_NODE_34404_length_272_cov_0.601156_1_plen_64_part_01